MLILKNDLDVTIISYDSSYIDCVVRCQDFGVFYVTNLYGNPYRNQREYSWELLRRLTYGNSLPWVVLGDFNDITSQQEQLRKNLRPKSQIDAFKYVVNDCGLIDMCFKGYKLHGVIKERLVISHKVRQSLNQPYLANSVQFSKSVAQENFQVISSCHNFQSGKLGSGGVVMKKFALRSSR